MTEENKEKSLAWPNGAGEKPPQRATAVSVTASLLQILSCSGKSGR
jgi:hypothetical protein